MQNYRILYILLITLWLIGVSPLSAQDNPVTAQVDRMVIGSDERVTLSVIVNGANAAQPEMPVMDGLQIVSQSSSSQFSFINGKTSAQVTYQYMLQPTSTGTLEIPALHVVVDGKPYETAPIQIEVTQGSTQSQSGNSGQDGGQVPAPDNLNNQELFVEASVDQPTVYLGQQVVYTFRFYQAVDLFDQPSYQAPDFTGFWHEQKSDQSQSIQNINGRSYQVIQLQTILFPTVPGEQTIDAATLTIPNSIFQQGGVLQTEPIQVTVKPLPSPAPDGFSGAVGQMTISATISTNNGSANQVAVNEPVTLRISLRGAGNLSTWPDPVVPDLNGWRKFDSTTKTNSVVQNGRLGGMRNYEQLLVAKNAGELVIPAIRYLYFDPEQGMYQTLQTATFTLTIKAAAAEAPIPSVANAEQSPVTAVGSDIRHIKAAPTTLAVASQPLTNNPLYWLAWGVPLLLIIGDWLWQARRQRINSDPILLRRIQAQKKARQALSQARKGAGDPYPIVGQVLNDYLSDKLNQPVSGWTHTLLSERLTTQGLDPKWVEQVNQLLMRSEMGRFAPINQASINQASVSQNGSGENLLDETEMLIDNLEKSLSV